MNCSSGLYTVARELTLRHLRHSCRLPVSFFPSTLSLVHPTYALSRSLTHTSLHLASSNMSDEKKDEHPPPPPYTPYSGPGDAAGTLQQSQESSISGHQQQEECTTTTGSSSSLWRRMLRRAPISSQRTSAAAAPARQVYAGAIGIRTIPGTSRPWRWHTGDRKNRHGAMLAKLPPPFMPLTIVALCALDITCYPP